MQQGETWPCRLSDALFIPICRRSYAYGRPETRTRGLIMVARKKGKKGAFLRGHAGYGQRNADADADDEPDAGARANGSPPVALAHSHTRPTRVHTHTRTHTRTRTRTHAHAHSHAHAHAHAHTFTYRFDPFLCRALLAFGSETACKRALEQVQRVADTSSQPPPPPASQNRMRLVARRRLGSIEMAYSGGDRSHTKGHA